MPYLTANRSTGFLAGARLELRAITEFPRVKDALVARVLFTKFLRSMVCSFFGIHLESKD
jgi:hypothetical protein